MVLDCSVEVFKQGKVWARACRDGGEVKRPCKAMVQQMWDLGCRLAPNIWNVLRGQVFIHPLPLLSGGRSCVDTMGMKIEVKCFHSRDWREN